MCCRAGVGTRNELRTAATLSRIAAASRYIERRGNISSSAQQAEILVVYLPTMKPISSTS
jgi:hypothetical protein